MRTVPRSIGFAALLGAFALSACSSGAPPLASPAANAAAPVRVRVHPAEGANALPGEGANALPGAILPCVFNPAQGQANCTVAVNTVIPPLNDPTQPASLIPGLHPADLASAYGLPSQNPGRLVAIVDAYDDPTAESDMGIYRLAFGLKACTFSNGCFRKVNEQGAASSYPQVNTAWADEIALDLDMVSATCPNCTILLVEASSASIDDLGKSVDEAYALGARVISNSYYAFEWPKEASEDVHYHHGGAAITASSGDAAETFYPAASPYVTAVGGTSLKGSAGAWTESGWKFAGGGCASYEPRPSFQAGVVRCPKRSAVDVAAVADPQTGVATFATSAGGWIVAGGTSVGAPLIASAYALSGNLEGPGFSYSRRSAFHDVLPAGYDFLTGIGTPNGVTGL